MIDGGNDQPWPAAVAGQLAQFRQGSIVGRPPFAYHASATNPLWVASRLAGPGEDPLLVELDSSDRTPYGIITSQSCDVDEEGRNRKPWVQIAPVYELAAGHVDLGNIRSWRFAYLAPVTALGPTWVADLRIEFPVEKSWLVRQLPQPGFNSPGEFDRFARFCGDFRSRPGLATSVYELLLAPLRRTLVQLASSAADVQATFVQQVQHLFLDVRGDRLQPETVQLIFVSAAAFDGGVVEHLEAWWESTYAAGGLPFILLPNRYLAFDEVRFAESRTWFEQDLARLATES